MNGKILIRGGGVVDGSGTPARAADVLVDGGFIAAVGNLMPDAARGARVIDAGGLILAPGFIDAHAHADPILQTDFHHCLAMGVTTVCLGQDGTSPTRGGFAKWLAEVGEARPGVNIATLAGHGTLREESGIGYKKNPSGPELSRMAGLLDDAMRAGAFGLSTGLEYEPGCFAQAAELAVLAQAAARQGGLIMSHMRSEDDAEIEAALDEFLDQGRAGPCPVHVSHLKIVYAHGAARAEAILDRLERARRDGLRVTADLYPYAASYTTIGILFPEWAKPPNAYAEVLASRRDELAAWLRRRIEARNGPGATLLGTPPYAGLTLEQAAARRGAAFEEILVELGPDGASAAYFVMDPEVIERLLLDPHVMISSDGSPDFRHPRSYGAFARIIREYVVRKGVLPIEQAIHKMTALTAGTIGFGRERGQIAPGRAADLVLFDPARVEDRAAFDDPHRLADGFDWVMVNGQFARENGEFTGVRAGKALASASARRRPSE